MRGLQRVKRTYVLTEKHFGTFVRVERLASLHSGFEAKKLVVLSFFFSHLLSPKFDRV